MPAHVPVGTTIEPQEDNVFIQLYMMTEHQGGNIIIPDVAQEEIFFGRIVRQGPGKMIDLDKTGNVLRLPMIYCDGDDVMFARYRGERICIGKHLFAVMRQDDILSKATLPPNQKDKFFKFATEGDTKGTAFEVPFPAGIPA